MEMPEDRGQLKPLLLSCVESSGYNTVMLVVLVINKVLIKLHFISCFSATNLWSSFKPVSFLYRSKLMFRISQSIAKCWFQIEYFTLLPHAFIHQ